MRLTADSRLPQGEALHELTLRSISQVRQARHRRTDFDQSSRSGTSRMKTVRSVVGGFAGTW